MTSWAPRVLDEVDAGAGAAERRLAELVAVPSIGGTDAEHEIQAMLAAELSAAGLETDHWRLPLPELLAAPDFPGVEVERDEAWGLVARLPGRGDGPTLMLNGHVDVVPTGDPAAWSTPDPFSGRVVGGAAARARRVRHEGRSGGRDRRGDRRTPGRGAAAGRRAAGLRAGRGGRRARHLRDAAPRLDAPMPAWCPNRPASTWSPPARVR